MPQAFRTRLPLLLSLLAPVLLLAAPMAVQANAAPLVRLHGPGGLVVPATTKDVRIEHERLSFDLTGPAATARAAYDLANVSGKDVELDLVFISPIRSDLAITLDGVRLGVQEESAEGLPREWQLSTRSVDPLTGQEYDVSGSAARAPSSAYSFHLQLRAGAKATLEAEFTPLMSEDRGHNRYITRHLTYVLGPANNWAGFGRLDVSVAVPAKYVLGASPALDKLGESDGVARYGDSFAGIPAEVLKLSTISVAATAPLPLWERVKMPFGIAVPIVAAVLAGLGFGGWLARIRRPWLAGLAAGGLALVATAAIGAGVMALVTMPVPVADPQELAGPTDYGAMILQILWGIGVVVVLPILAAALAGLRASTLSSRRNRLG